MLHCVNAIGKVKNRTVERCCGKEKKGSCQAVRTRGSGLEGLAFSDGGLILTI